MNTNAQALFTLLGASNVYVADISTYESPDFLIDLNCPIVDTTLHQRFDTIVDVGTLEHVFNVAVALRNICLMLKDGGNIVLILPCSIAIDHGFFSYSPTLFFDYFCANGFENISCYLVEGSPYNYERKGKVWQYGRGGGAFRYYQTEALKLHLWLQKMELVALSQQHCLSKAATKIITFGKMAYHRQARFLVL